MCRSRSALIGGAKKATAKSPGRTPSANTFKFCNRIPPTTDTKAGGWRGRSGPTNETARAVERCAQGVARADGRAVTGRVVLSEDQGVNNLGSDRSIP